MQARSSPLHYVSTDGYDIYVGKKQFPERRADLQIRHRKRLVVSREKMAGSHVVVKSKDGELPTACLRRPDDWPLTIPRGALLPRWKSTISRKARKKAWRGETGLCGVLYQLFTYGRTGY